MPMFHSVFRAVAVLLFVAAQAYAEERPTLIPPTLESCFTRSALALQLADKYGETLKLRIIFKGGLEEMQFYKSDLTGTFTWLKVNRDAQACITRVGKDEPTFMPSK